MHIDGVDPSGVWRNLNCDYLGNLIVVGGGTVNSSATVATIAQVNATATLVAAIAGKAIKVTGFLITARGGAMTGATNLIIRDSSGVVVATILASALTQDTDVPSVVSAYVTLGTFNAALTSGASLVLAATGTVTGSTYFDIAFNYAMV